MPPKRGHNGAQSSGGSPPKKAKLTPNERSASAASWAAAVTEDDERRAKQQYQPPSGSGLTSASARSSTPPPAFLAAEEAAQQQAALQRASQLSSAESRPSSSLEFPRETPVDQLVGDEVDALAETRAQAIIQAQEVEQDDNDENDARPLSDASADSEMWDPNRTKFASRGAWNKIHNRMRPLCHDRPTLTANQYNNGPVNTPPHFKKGEVGFKRTVKKCVALDCEFVTCEDRQPHLAQVVLVDVRTGKSLVDVLVTPPLPIRSYNTKWSGLSEDLYRRYATRGAVVDGVQAAKEQIFEHVDQDTIIVGHALQNDLNRLGIIHTLCFDTQIYVRAIFDRFAEDDPTQGKWSLSDLCKDLLGINIQTVNHDCYEDTIATRELAIFLLEDGHDDAFETWYEEVKNSKQANQGKKQRAVNFDFV
ncbi:ribonuclease H-like domain-containing protein [Aspergillus karnatakaensis]|uniref:ribonuclease H-like domain-containing protein n=1 Tax=Aspergillus karnatakaensis TaxID=1810916 RepID=UPI003CCD013A